MKIICKKTLPLGKLKDRLSLSQEHYYLFFFQFLNEILYLFENKSYSSILNEIEDLSYIEDILYKEKSNFIFGNKKFSHYKFITDILKKIIISSFDFYDVIKYEIKFDRFFFDYRDIIYYSLSKNNSNNLISEEEIFIYMLIHNINPNKIIS